MAETNVRQSFNLVFVLLADYINAKFFDMALTSYAWHIAEAVNGGVREIFATVNYDKVAGLRCIFSRSIVCVPIRCKRIIENVWQCTVVVADVAVVVVAVLAAAGNLPSVAVLFDETESTLFPSCNFLSFNQLGG